MFFVQGEGRGHMTQAICLYELLISEGHSVCAVVLGSSGIRETPSFFYERVKTDIINLTSPNFVADKKNKSINLGKSIFHNVRRLKTFRRSLHTIGELFEQYKPDAVINFFDLLAGLYYFFNKPSVPMICVAHQYIYLHREFKFPKGRLLDRFAIKLFTSATSSYSERNLALSFYKIHGESNQTIVVAPLLRREVFEQPVSVQDFYLIYLVNSGYYEEIIEWHKRHNHVRLKCFTDKRLLEGRFDYYHPNLELHQVNDLAFLQAMAACRGLITSAGFESVCEAMYFGKPVLMVPIKGHYEQFCNSRDGFKAGAGIYDDNFNISKLLDYTTFYSPANEQYRKWVMASGEKIIEEINAVIYTSDEIREMKIKPALV